MDLMAFFIIIIDYIIVAFWEKKGMSMGYLLFGEYCRRYRAEKSSRHKPEIRDPFRGNGSYC